MDFQTKVVNAMVQVEKGCSLKDFLDDEEIIEALAMLADILVVSFYLEAGMYTIKDLEELLADFKIAKEIQDRHLKNTLGIKDE